LLYIIDVGRCIKREVREIYTNVDEPVSLGNPFSRYVNRMILLSSVCCVSRIRNGVDNKWTGGVVDVDEVYLIDWTLSENDEFLTVNPDWRAVQTPSYAT
jgi:hypothetical protein